MSILKVLMKMLVKALVKALALVQVLMHLQLALCSKGNRRNEFTVCCSSRGQVRHGSRSRSAVAVAVVVVTAAGHDIGGKHGLTIPFVR